MGICTAIKIISAAIFVFDWLLIRWKYKLDMEGTMTVGDIVNSLMSVDKDGDEPSDDLEESVWLPSLQGTQQAPPPGAASQTTSAPQTGPTTSAAAAHHHYHHRRNGSLISRPQVPPHGSGEATSELSIDNCTKVKCS